MDNEFSLSASLSKGHKILVSVFKYFNMADP